MPDQTHAQDPNSSMYQPFQYKPPTQQYSLGNGDYTTNYDTYKAQLGNTTSVPGVGTMSTADAAKYSTPPNQLPQPQAPQNASTTPQPGMPVPPGQQNNVTAAPQNQTTPQTGVDQTQPPVQPDLGPKYNTAFNSVTGQAPQTAGDARSAVTQATDQYQPPQTQQAYQPSPAFMQVGDPIMQNFMQAATQSLQDITQTGYAAQYMQANMANQVHGLDLQAMNMQNIINGSRDDIRAEISKAGGFATESQIEGLVTTRNRDLLKQYNNIELQKQTMQNQMQMQVQLAQMDHTYAVDKFNNVTKSFDMYKNIYDNATDQLNQKFQKGGYQALADISQGDPYHQSLIEQHLQLPQGFLSDPAQVKSADENLYRQQSLMMANQRLGMAAQRLNIYVGNNTATPQATNSQLNYFATTGQVPSFKNAAQSNAFWQSLGAQDPNVIGDATANKQIRTAMGSALTDQTQQQATVQRGIDAADKNFGLLTTTFKGKVNNLNSPLANQVSNMVKGGLIGNSDVINFQSAVATLQTEYSTVLGRGGTVTDKVRSSADHVVNGNYSMNDLINLHDYIVKEGKNVVSSYGDTINSINKNLRGLGKPQTSQSQSVNIGGQSYDVGSVVTNKQGKKGRIESDGSITPLP